MLHWFKFALQNTLRNRRRSAVTVGIAALGTAAILLGGGFALFTYQSLAESSARDTGHLVIATPKGFADDEDFALQHGIASFPALRDQLLADPDVRYVLPRVQFGGLISNGDKSAVAFGIGVDPSAEFAVKGPFLSIKSGQALSADANAQSPTIVVGTELARQLKAQPGSSLTLLSTTSEGAMNAIDATVVGTFSVGVPDLDRRLVYTDLATAQALVRSDRVSSVGVFLRRLPLAEAARDRIAATQPSLEVRTWEQQAFFYRAVKALYNRIFGALGLVIACIVVVVVGAVMAMAIVERTREIGTLRALGTAPGQLVRAFSLEGLVLGGAGALAGAAFAGFTAWALLKLNVQMPPPPGRSNGYPLHVYLSPALLTATTAAITLLTTVAAALVSRRAVRQPIVEALGHV